MEHHQIHYALDLLYGVATQAQQLLYKTGQLFHHSFILKRINRMGFYKPYAEIDFTMQKSCHESLKTMLDIICKFNALLMISNRYD